MPLHFELWNIPFLSQVITNNNSCSVIFITAKCAITTLRHVQHLLPSLKVYSAFHPSGVSKWVPAAAGKAKADMAHFDCRWTCGCAGKTVRSLENTCHTGALLRWRFTTKRRYIKFMHLYLLGCINLTNVINHTYVRLGSIVVRELDLWSVSCQFDSRPLHCWTMRFLECWL